MFVCEMCGECCRNLDKSELYASLHDGNGICRYLRGNLCSVYERRPLLCRVDECYAVFVKDKMSYKLFINSITRVAIY